MKYYAGIGSRQTPPDILAQMTAIARRLTAKGYCLRSGRAQGADRAFERAADKKEIWTPHDCDISPEAYELAASIHPAWGACSAFARACHARNCFQVLGQSLDQLVQFVCCWTRCGSETEEATTRETGGTRTAIVLAHRHGIPVFNLRNPDAFDRLRAFVEPMGQTPP